MSQTRSAKLWRLTLITIVFFLLINATYYYYFEKSAAETDSKTYAAIQEIIIKKVGVRKSTSKNRVLLMSYSELGANLSRSVLASHPDVWFWQPFSMKMVSKQHAELDLVIKQTNLMIIHAFECNLSSEQMTGIEMTSPPFKCQLPGVAKTQDEITICINQMCTERQTKVVSFRDSTLNELYDIIHINKLGMRIVLFHEVPEKVEEVPNKTEADEEYRHLCHHLVSDTQRAAELDGLYPGIRKNYFINEFRQNWHEQVASLQRYLNVSQKIMTEPDWSKSRNLEQKIAPELWKELHMKCIKNKSYTLTTDSLDSP